MFQAKDQNTSQNYKKARNKNMTVQDNSNS